LALEILRKLRWVFYPLVFGLVFLFAAYCTFPKGVVREMAESTLTSAAIGIGPRTRGMPQVSMKDVSLWRLSGVSLQGLKVEWPGKMTESPMVLEIDEAKARLGIFAALTGSRSVSSSFHLYEGDLDADFKIGQKTGLSFATATGSNINVGKMTFLEMVLGAPLKGLLNLAVDIGAKSEMTKDGSGFVRINVDNFSFGPGVVNLPAGGFVSSLTVPAVNLGKLAIDLNLEKGLLESKLFSLTGGDVEADLKLTIGLNKKPAFSKVDGSGWFSVKREFVNANETLKMLFDLIPELRAAQLGDGKVGISIRGTLARPMPRLERFLGEKPAKKAVADKEQTH
jgi:type II secretion system protein N